ncbi:MAG: type IV pilus twitching motility protein PilT [Christensenellaceae bacterium]|jgi:twitching motility protein PilT
MELLSILNKAAELNASDIFIITGLPLTYKINNRIETASEERISAGDSHELLENMYALANRPMERLMESGDDDFSFSLPGVSRFRINAYRQRGSLAAVVRKVAFELPDPKELNIPESVLSLSNRSKGLVLVTGSAGSGKSTTLACILDRINSTRRGHIVTLEDPIEYLHKHQQCIVSQREIAIDTDSYVTALRASLRQSPDVILIGELRDYETINIAMTAAETGHLVLSSMHTVGAANTIDRVIDAFPANQQAQIRVQLSMVLEAVVSQQLLPTTDGRVVPAFEIMLVNSAIRNMIRESKIHQIDNVIASSGTVGMVSMDASLISLYERGVITKEDAIIYSSSTENMEKRLSQM